MTFLSTHFHSSLTDSPYAILTNSVSSLGRLNVGNVESGLVWRWFCLKDVGCEASWVGATCRSGGVLFYLWLHASRVRTRCVLSQNITLISQRVRKWFWTIDASWYVVELRCIKRKKTKNNSAVQEKLMLSDSDSGVGCPCSTEVILLNQIARWQ